MAFWDNTGNADGSDSKGVGAEDFLAQMRAKHPAPTVPINLPAPPGQPLKLVFERERDRIQRALQDVATISLCESPIEQKLFDAFLSLGFSPGPCGVVRKEGNGFPPMLLELQYETPGYRVDFSISTGRIWIAVEADGHEWHEKTKEQAQRDKFRDRSLIQYLFSGVLRFTGSEINANARGCAEEVICTCAAVHNRST
jgi:very-short-patch-repair endonuclease